MITMNELVDLRMQQHLAHELYRQQIMQRIPDPFPAMLPVPIPRHVLLPPRVTLPGVEATLQNKDLWTQFHQLGTEMIITKCGRRMFPSMRLSLSGLEDDTNYCVLLEMVPIGDCRYKFSGSHWVPAGGAEPQSPQRMYLHPDSPASGSHWKAQPILFNKVKLTNNTLDNNGHTVLASMHKYQPRIHIIKTSDPTQIPWAPQQPFVFPETEFIAVTAYQNDRITKLKIDNNPFAKGFRETGQSRCKRKTTVVDEQALNKSTDSDKNRSDSPESKRFRSNSSACSISSFDEVVSSSSGASSPNVNVEDTAHNLLNHPAAQPAPLPSPIRNELLMQHMQNMQSLMNPAAFADLAYTYFGRPPFASQLYPPHPSLPLFYPPPNKVEAITPPLLSPNQTSSAGNDQIDVTTVVDRSASDEEESSSSSSDKTPKKKNFSISSILER
uniref:Dorsocross 2 n=1 Tax=Megaselia abdita TaxID=88686 RepID=A0A2Z2E6P6_MEGAB|nr:dorsocross 2 [Megaselia abdita]